MKAVLISSIPLPYDKIGSWNKRYSELILSEQNPFDYIICPKFDNKFLKNNTSFSYLFANRYKKESFLKIFYKYSYYFFLKQIKVLLKNEKQLVIQIIDNVKLLNEVHDYLTQIKQRHQCKIIFNSCGYSYFFNPHQGIQFYDKIDHIIFSTNEAYQFELNRYSYISSKVTIIPNGIDSSKFFKVSNDEKQILKKQLGFENQNIILWISQDRPKKGLHIFLEAWKNSKLYNNPNYILLIIGTPIKKLDNNIQYLGKIVNDKLPIYYQISDYYFFTTLVHEGFGLSLAEALKCGSTCFASNIAPMHEVTKNQKLAYLVDNPNDVSRWIDKLNQINEKEVQNIELTTLELEKLYNLKDWCKNMADLVFYEKKQHD